MSLSPFPPEGIVRWDFRKPPFEIHSLYSHEPFFVGIPKRSGLFIVQHEGVFIRPSRGGKGEFPAVNFAAVHSHQVRQRSVPGSNRFFTQAGVGNLMKLEFRNGIGACLRTVRDADDPGVFIKG